MSDELREKVADIFTKAEYGFPFNSLIDHSRERMLNSTDAAIALVRAEQADRIAQLEAENASLASWQCEFTDGKTGLVYGEGGSTYCAMAKRVKELEGQHKGLVLQNALLRQRRDLPVDRIPAAQEVDTMRARIAQLEAALQRIDRMEVYEADAAVVLWAKIGIMRDIARAALEEPK
jgi:hypothetical protein